MMEMLQKKSYENSIKCLWSKIIKFFLPALHFLAYADVFFYITWEKNIVLPPQWYVYFPGNCILEYLCTVKTFPIPSFRIGEWKKCGGTIKSEFGKLSIIRSLTYLLQILC